MKICFFTNTFLPHVGGVARSVQTLLEDFRRRRHRVIVVAPEFANARVPRRIERSVERVPAVQNFNGSDFSVRLPLGTVMSERLGRFQPDIIHAHHPFLLGDTALRVAAQRTVPVIFTHHTLYEQYTHYVPFDSPQLKEFVIDLSTRFANCCQGVIAPSESIAQILKKRGVTVPVTVVPTGIDTDAFSKGRGSKLRKRFGIPSKALVLGHVGRLAPEKNLGLLTEAVARCLRRKPTAHFLLTGDGPSREEMEKTFARCGVQARVHWTGKLSGRALNDAYAAMDVFVFTSHSETQGMVIAEAMASGNPVIALDASGVREVVEDRINGRLLPAKASAESLARALVRAVNKPDEIKEWSNNALRTAKRFDRSVTASRALEFYQETIAGHGKRPSSSDWENTWTQWMDRVAIEGRMLGDKVGAAARALLVDTTNPATQPAGS